ncbi:MAG: hypothetical protein ACTSU6_00910 [Candidatus Njordarchaeales archaeon]
MNGMKNLLLLSALISTTKALSNAVFKGNNIFHFSTEHTRFLNKKVGKLSFILITSKDLTEDSLKTILDDLSREFIRKYGDEPDRIMIGLPGDKANLSEFNDYITKVVYRAIGESVDHLNRDLSTTIENIFSELSRGTSIKKIRQLFEPVKIPILIKKEIIGKERDPKKRAILQLCNGINSIEDISKALNLSKIQVMEIITKYKKKKYIICKTGFRPKVRAI